MKILVSACLLGENCKYSGGNNRNEQVLAFIRGHEVVPVCPEEMGGLPTPRPPAEIVRGEVVNRDGVSVDREFRLGAQKALEIARAAKVIGKSLEAKVTVYGKEGDDVMKAFAAHADELEELFIVSKVELSYEAAPEGAFTETESGVAVLVEVASGEKCVRCWAYRDDCEQDDEGQCLCGRCRQAVC